MPLDLHRNTETLFRQVIFVSQRFTVGVLCVSFSGPSLKFKAVPSCRLIESTCTIPYSFLCIQRLLNDTSWVPSLMEMPD